MLVDYHIHTAHSIDAKNSLVEYCERALEIGLEQICFTNHCEIDEKRNDNFIVFDERRQPVDRRGIERLFNEMNRCRDHYQGRGLDVRCGIEIGFFPGIERQVELLIENQQFDYVLGSIHCLDHVCIDSSREHKSYFDDYPAQTMLRNYYQAISELVDCGLFDAVAHLDVYKKYGIAYYGPEINCVPRDMLESIFRKMKSKRIALEINTAGLRRIGQMYPSEDIMSLARKTGIDLLVIGSDAHSIDQLGAGLNEGYEYVRSRGYNELCTFKARKLTKIKPEGKLQLVGN